MGKRGRWDFSVSTQGSERACGWCLTFVRHNDKRIGAHLMLEVFWLWDVHISWNWY